MVVGLSGGTTTTAIAAALAAREDLAAEGGITVVTNAVNIAAQLATRPEIKVVVTGGVIHSRTYELVGPFVEQLLRGVRLDLAFIGVNGMDAAAGATTQDEREAAVNRMMAERARRAVVVTDGSKLGVEAFSTVGGPELFATVITDRGADGAAVDALRAAGTASSSPEALRPPADTPRASASPDRRGPARASRLHTATLPSRWCPSRLPAPQRRFPRTDGASLGPLPSRPVARHLPKNRRGWVRF